jgi:outer membrane protein
MRRAVWSCLALFAAGSLAAQTPPAGGAAAPARQAAATGLKIAVIRSQEILQRTPGFAAAESTLTREIQGYRAEVEKLQKQLDSAVTAFDQQSIALTPAARQTRQRELQQMQQKLQERGGALQDRAAQRQQELLSPINARIRAIIEGIRAEENYALVFDIDAPGTQLVAVDPALNITARVIQRLQGSQ